MDFKINSHKCRHDNISSKFDFQGAAIKVFDLILIILAGNDDIHKSLDEFQIWPDSSTDYGVSCP